MKTGKVEQVNVVEVGATDGGKLAQELYIHAYEDRVRERLHAAFRKPITPDSNAATVSVAGEAEN